MAVFNICPICGNRTTEQTKTNAAGDTLARWHCTVTADYSSEWDLRTIAPPPVGGTADTPSTALLGDDSTATEGTVAAMVDVTRRRLDDLLSRIGPVTPGDSLVEVMRRVYGAVDTLEISSDSIALNADAINLNTDTLEGLVGSTNSRIGDPLDPDTADTMIGRLKNIRALIAAAEVARDTDATAAQARLDLLATEAGLTAARDQIVAKNEQIRLLAAGLATRDDFLNQRQVQESFVARRARDGLAFMSSSGKLTLLAAGHLRFTISNPAGSTRSLYLYKVSADASAGPAWATPIINPATGLPAASRPIVNKLLGGPVAVATVAADTHTTDPLGGGTATGVALGVYSGTSTVDFDAPWIISPGNSVGFNVPFAGAADAAFAVHWYEQ